MGDWSLCLCFSPSLPLPISLSVFISVSIFLSLLISPLHPSCVSVFESGLFCSEDYLEKKRVFGAFVFIVNIRFAKDTNQLRVLNVLFS